ncbi:MAG: 16S rRNA (cytidine(1402)-2'-O)-methyltransferase [Chloroflexi bacterium RBG_13_50_10]|nr:MAG: 16S rRNA (cytidine(1402)-2'-O)-methyltransferase [Chloroflexi bacterium RBG_13_50_10]
MPSLYVVATPIGNLEDISLRALRLLKQVKLIAAEDTRTARQLLNFYDIKTPLTSYHEHNKKAKLGYILGCLKEKDVALVSEAGMPGLSDPGYELIAAAIERGISVVPVPGASAVITALVVSGLPTDQFLYLGFLPRRQGARRRLFKSVADEPRTMVVFEAPHRILETLNDALEVFGDRKAAVCRELTKVYEEVFRGRLSQAIEHFAQPRGEFTLVIEGKARQQSEVDRQIESELHRLYRQGAGAKEAVAQLSEASGISKKKLYQAWLKVAKGD